jgi:hypothetical protein
MILRVLEMDPNPKDAETGKYSLHAATECGDWVMMEELLKYRVAPDIRDERWPDHATHSHKKGHGKSSLSFSFAKRLTLTPRTTKVGHHSSTLHGTTTRQRRFRYSPDLIHRAPTSSITSVAIRTCRPPSGQRPHPTASRRPRPSSKPVRAPKYPTTKEAQCCTKPRGPSPQQ